MRTPKPLHLELKRSRLLAGYLVLVHGLAAWVLVAVLSNVLIVFALTAVLLSAAYYWRRFLAFKHRNAVSALNFANNHWQVLRVGKTDFEGVKWQDATILSWVVVLRFSDFSGHPLNIAIFGDQLDPQVFRRLRVIAGFAALSGADN